jgi:hypothetical protein
MIAPRYNIVTFVELDTMAFIDCAKHSGRDTWSDPKPWPREVLTLALVCGSVGFWAVLILAAGTI